MAPCHSELKPEILQWPNEWISIYFSELTSSHSPLQSLISNHIFCPSSFSLKGKKKKKTQNSKSYFFSQDLWFWSLYWAHFWVSLWHFIQSSALFSPWIALKDSSLMCQEVNLSVFISQLCESSEDFKHISSCECLRDPWKSHLPDFFTLCLPLSSTPEV